MRAGSVCCRLLPARTLRLFGLSQLLQAAHAGALAQRTQPVLLGANFCSFNPIACRLQGRPLTPAHSPNDPNLCCSAQASASLYPVACRLQGRPLTPAHFPNDPSLWDEPLDLTPYINTSGERIHAGVWASLFSKFLPGRIGGSAPAVGRVSLDLTPCFPTLSWPHTCCRAPALRPLQPCESPSRSRWSEPTSCFPPWACGTWWWWTSTTACGCVSQALLSG